MLSDEIRKKFLDFFQKKEHKILPSFSLIPSKDKTLLLINAGMAPMKPYFLGTEAPPASKIATSQKCIRVIDIEKVGKTIRHLTFFEMLGNFSFGDYFKEKAIPYAWEFLTDWMRLPKEKLYISIYLDDEESYNIWTKEVGIPSAKIYRFGEEHNFWSAGPTGPCGPDSEIFIDLGEDFSCGRDNCNPSCDCDRFIEVWNLVFMQYAKKEDGTLEPLPKKNIDTGMGLERLAMIMQNAISPYQTNLFTSIIEHTRELLGDGVSEENLRIIADHLRAGTFLVADGVFPSNEGRGYVLRRLLRRATRIGKLYHKEKPFLYKIVPNIVNIMKDAYPEVKNKLDFICKVIKTEEERFLQTIKIGEEKLYQIIDSSKEQKIIKGEDVFKLYDTYGFPKELTQEIAGEYNFSIDEETFKKLLQEQQERARQHHQMKLSEDKLNFYNNLASIYKTDFVGDDEYSVKSKIISIIKNNEIIDTANTGDEIEILLDKTPFYAEKGGQIGDTGKLRLCGRESDFGSCGSQIEIIDTQRPVEELIVHYGKVVDGKFTIGENVIAEIDIERRKNIARHHTSTHLLHYALRKVLGEDVHQTGSMVSDDRFRFDYTYFTSPQKEEIEEVENIINTKIIQNLPVCIYFTSYEQAKSSGAIALFEEKYKEKVRVVEIENISKELCGGTHCKNTGEIGICKIISERSIASGIRRIEAVSGMPAFMLISSQLKILKDISHLLKINHENILSKLNNILKEHDLKTQEINSLKRKLFRSEADEILKRGKQKNNIRIIIERVDNCTFDELMEICDLIKNKITSFIIVLASVIQDKINFVGMASKDLSDSGIDISLILKDIAKITSGSAGGKKNLAQGGGKKIEKLSDALIFAEKIITEILI